MGEKSGTRSRILFWRGKPIDRGRGRCDRRPSGSFRGTEREPSRAGRVGTMSSSDDEVNDEVYDEEEDDDFNPNDDGAEEYEEDEESDEEEDGAVVGVPVRAPCGSLMVLPGHR